MKTLSSKKDKESDKAPGRPSFDVSSSKQRRSSFMPLGPMNGLNKFANKMSNVQHLKLAAEPVQEIQKESTSQEIVTKQRRDSELESQMDDFMINDESETSSVSLTSSNDHFPKIGSANKMSMISRDSSLSFEPSELSYEDNYNPEAQILKRMRDFYDSNYKLFDIMESADFLNQRIWNVCYDKKFDFIYIFLAKLSPIRRSRILDFKPRTIDNDAKDKITSMLDSGSKGRAKVQIFGLTSDGIKSPKDTSPSPRADESEDDVGEKTLQMYKDLLVQIELQLQVWSIDDRVINDKDHKRLPISEHLLLSKEVELSGNLGLNEQMEQCRNKFQDYANLIQHEGKVHAFNAKSQIITYDVEPRNMWVNRFTITREEKESLQPQAFQNHLFIKDLGKKSQVAELILQVSYYQFQKAEAEQPGVNPTLKLLASLIKKKKKQKLGLKVFNYSDPAKNKRSLPKIKEASCYFEDDALIEYYEPQGHTVRSFFLQRIAETTSFVLLFPTGLLFHICSTPFSIQQKMQLNLKKDETIIDVAYCVDSNRKNHYLWLIDEKYQVWKCMNELNPNNCTWTLSKISVLEPSPYNRFFVPAVTPQDFYLTTDLFDLQCLHQENMSKQHELLFTYNESTTKAIIVKQPALSNGQGIGESESFLESSGYSIDAMLDRRFGIDLKELNKFKIQVLAVCKSQQIILNKIPLKKDAQEEFSVKKMQRISMQAKDFKFKMLKDLGKRSNPSFLEGDANLEEFLMMTSEIVSFIYVGKVLKSDILQREEELPAGGPRNLTLRQFIIRRKRSLEIMYTNGLLHWSEFLEGAEVNSPNFISGLHLSTDYSLLMVQFSTLADESVSTMKTFKRSPQGHFELSDDIYEYGRRDLHNLVIDSDNSIKEIQVDLIYNSKVQSKPRQSIYIERRKQKSIITVPESVFTKELVDQNSFQKLIISRDRQIVIEDRIIIQLTPALDEVRDIGCLVYSKTNEEKYKFYSLIDKAERKIIFEALRNKKKELVKFDALVPPTFPNEAKHSHFYVLHSVEEPTQETALLKVYVESLKCFEIYRSKTRVNNIDLFMLNSLDGDLQKKRSSTAVLPTISQRQLGLASEEEPLKKKQPTILISLVSQRANKIFVEVLSDKYKRKKQEGSGKNSEKLDSVDLSFGHDDSKLITNRPEEPGTGESKYQQRRSRFERLTSFSFTGTLAALQDEEETQGAVSKLEYLVNVGSKAELQTQCQVGWITRDKLLLTLNNDYFLLNLKHTDLVPVKTHFLYGIQQVNMELFSSIVKIHERQAIENSEQARVNQLVSSAQSCINRMETANLRKFYYLKSGKKDDMKRKLLFFTPSEELYGGNVFARLSNNYKIIQPYLDAIDSDFIKAMNLNVHNIAVFTDPSVYFVEGRRLNLEGGDALDGQPIEPTGEQVHDLVHMYQVDILGFNAIDYAFQKNAIFCIKAFVETLMILPDEVQFRNCFDKALLMMIKRGINVKQLVNSELFYPTIWKEFTLFSSVREVQMVPFNNSITDLEFEDPYALFSESSAQAREEDAEEGSQPSKRRSRMWKYQPASLGEQAKEEMLEMQYKYIFMEKIENISKIEVSKTLKECDFEIFEQESIQNIIDYKWDTYAREYFFQKFCAYMIFLGLYYIDMESVMYADKEGLRIKGPLFYTCKIICSAIQFFFFSYEIMQIQIEGSEYFEDAWNYMELGGNALFAWGAYLDIAQPQVSPNTMIVFALSIMFTLIKVVYLIRVFRQLNFLVTMFINVVNEIKSFMILFSIFLLTFAKTFHLLGIDVSSYGRTPGFIAHLISVIRCAMGDFSMVDPNQGLDIHDGFDEGGEPLYKHSFHKMMISWLMFIICIFYMFMIFMNFIIAVIGESYSKVIQSKEAYDYQQRAQMIYEREVHFSPHHFENDQFFPKIIIVKKMKENEGSIKNNWVGFIAQIKASFKKQSSKLIETINLKTAEQKQHYSSQIKSFESELKNVSIELSKLFHHMNKLHPPQQSPTFVTPSEPIKSIEPKKSGLTSLAGDMSSQSSGSSPYLKEEEKKEDLGSLMKRRLLRMFSKNSVDTKKKVSSHDQINVFSSNLEADGNTVTPDGIITVGVNERKGVESHGLKVPSKDEPVQFEENPSPRSGGQASLQSKGSYKKMKNYLERKLEAMHSENSELKLMVQQILKNQQEQKESEENKELKKALAETRFELQAHVKVAKENKRAIYNLRQQLDSVKQTVTTIAEGQKSFLVRSRAASRSKTVAPSRHFEEQDKRADDDMLAQSSRIEKVDGDDLRQRTPYHSKSRGGGTKRKNRRKKPTSNKGAPTMRNFESETSADRPPLVLSENGNVFINDEEPSFRAPERHKVMTPPNDYNISNLVIEEAKDGMSNRSMGQVISSFKRQHTDEESKQEPHVHFEGHYHPLHLDPRMVYPLIPIEEAGELRPEGHFHKSPTPMSGGMLTPTSLPPLKKKRALPSQSGHRQGSKIYLEASMKHKQTMMDSSRRGPLSVRSEDERRMRFKSSAADYEHPLSSRRSTNRD